MTIYTLYWIHNPEHTDPYSQGYVGLTKRDPQERFKEHLQRKGLDGVEFTILSQGNESDISALEESYRPESHIGWNTAKGGLYGGRPTGIHTSGWTHSEESKQKRSDMVSGEGNGMYGKTQSEKQKRAVGESAKKRFTGVPKNYKVYNHVMHGKDNPKSRAIFGDGKYWESIHSCAKELGCNHNAIRYILNSDKEKWNGWYYEQERTEG